MAKDHRFPYSVAIGELALPASGPIGALNTHFVAGLGALADRLVCEQGFRPEHDRLAAAGFATSPVISGQFSTMAIFLGRHRNLNRANIARALGLLEPGGILVLDGQKTDGIDSLLRETRKFLPLEQTISRNHGKLAWTPPLKTAGAAPQEWAESGRLSPNENGFLTAPGMFSVDHADTGSQRLAQHFNGAIRGRVADLGAGWGWLSAALLKAAPKATACDLIEADHASLEAARLNVTDPRASFRWSDVNRLQQGTEPYDTVISNPPFHLGRAAEPGLGISFVATAAQILKPSGTALFVANRQLPYERAFEDHFADWSVIEQDGSYKVIRARRPRQQVAPKRYRARIR